MRERDTVGLNLKAPPEWDRFLDAVAVDNHGYESPYAGIAIERSFYEYREIHPAEEYANRLLEAVGRRGQDTREKTPQTRPVDSSEDGRRATVRVAREVKQDIGTYAAETGSPKHEVLRAVVCWYLDGGLLGLLTDKLEVAVPEAETQLAELDPGDDRGLTAEEKKRRWLADHLTDDDGLGAFTRDDFGDGLEAMPYRGGDTEHMRETHRQPVLNRIGYTKHPKNPDLFVPEEQAREYAEEEGIDPDAPAFERKPYDDLTDAEQVHKLRVELARRAVNSTDTIGDGPALKADAVRDDVFHGTPGVRKVKDLMDRAARAEGFETDAKGDGKRLRCDPGAVADREVLTDAGLTDPGEAGEADSSPGVDGDETGGNDPETDADARMDAIMEATPVADGGGE